MPSHLIETYPARILKSSISGELLERLILFLVPLEDFNDARMDVVGLYENVYADIDEVQDEFSGKSNPQLREWAVEPYSRIPEYDPHKSVTTLLAFLTKPLSWFKRLLTVIAVVGSLLSINWLYILGTGGLDVIEVIEGLVPLSFIALSIIFLWLLRADTFAHQTLAENLRAGPAMVQTRSRSEIVSYGLWNRSLLGQTGMLLVGIFFLLDSLSKIPLLKRWFDDPVGYVTNLISENIESLYSAKSTTGVIRVLYRQLI